MVDEKDRLGEKLRQKEKGEEDRFFAERDRELLERLRQQRSAAELAQLRELARMRCPKDGDRLTTVEEHGVTVEECPTCGGMWLDRGECELLAARERSSWLERYLVRPKR